MLLAGKTAVIYGAAGHIGAATARAFARDGARLFLAGRTLEKVEKIAAEIRAGGGEVEAAQVDALDKAAVDRHFAGIVEKAGNIDVSFNAISIRGDLQGTPVVDMTLEDFTTPVVMGVSTHFLTATAAARHMAPRGSGVILTMSSTAAGLSGRDHMMHSVGGFAVACTAIEALSRTLAGQLGPKGIRVVCLRSDGLPETWPADFAEKWPEQHLRISQYMHGGTLRGRLPLLEEVANAAVFTASDRASAMIGTILNLTCGSVLDSN